MDTDERSGVANRIVAGNKQALAQRSFGLVRRGLDDLAKSVTNKGRILIVNDQASFLEVMAQTLAANGYEVRSTSRHQDAIALAKSFDPHVAVITSTTPQEVRKGLLNASPSWPYFTPKVGLWGEVQELQGFEEQRVHYDFLLPTSVSQEGLLSAMQAWMAEAWTDSGSPLKDRDQWLEAKLKCHEKAITIDERCFKAWLNKAWCLGGLGRWSEAIDSYERAIEINSSDWRPWVWKGNLLDRVGRFEEALVCFDSALAMSKDLVSAWMGRGLALDHLGRYQEALLCYDEVLEMHQPTGTTTCKTDLPSKADVWCSRARSLYSLGQFDGAIVSYDEALKLDSNCFLAWNDKGNSLNHLDRYEEALPCFDRALEINPNEPAAWFNKGAALHHLGRLEEAVHLYQRVLELNPRYPDVLFNKALAEEKLGRTADAIHSYGQLISMAKVSAGSLLDYARKRLDELHGQRQI